MIVGWQSDHFMPSMPIPESLPGANSFLSRNARPGARNALPFCSDATPVLQTGRTKTVYAISSDGNLHALNAVNGEDRTPPKQFVPAFSRTGASIW